MIRWKSNNCGQDVSAVRDKETDKDYALKPLNKDPGIIPPLLTDSCGNLSSSSLHAVTGL